MIKRIDSSENPLIKKIQSLKMKKYRDKEGLYIIEGLRIVEDILLDEEKRKLVKNLILTNDNEELIDRDPFSGLLEKTIIINEKLVKDISDTVTAQGVFLLVEKEVKDLEEEIEKYSRVLLLDNISDPGNMGTLIRTALAADFEAVISFRGSVDIYNSKVVRSTMGGINKIDIFDSLEYKFVMEILRSNGFIVFSADLSGSRNIYDAFPEGKIALIMGSEASGVSVPEEYIDEKITIPMHEKSESLNVSVAAGILMYSINKSKFEK